MTSEPSNELPPAAMGEKDSHVWRWNTEDVTPRNRLDYWTNALAEAIVPLVVSSPHRRNFHCEMSTSNLDGMSLTHASGSRQVSFRTRRLVRLGASHSYYLVMDTTQPWVASHDGVRIRMNPRDLILLDSQQIHGGSFPDSCRVINLMFSAEWLLSWMEQPSRMVGRRIDRRAGWGATLSTFFAQLSPEALVVTSVSHRSISEHLGVLLSMVEGELAGGPGPGGFVSATSRERLARVVDVLRQRMAEPGLDAADVARTLGIPLPMLHEWLRDAGVMFLPLLQRQRAWAASDMLNSTRFDRLDTATIGRMVGLTDASHFARVMRRHLGESPPAHRRASIESLERAQGPITRD